MGERMGDRVGAEREELGRLSTGDLVRALLDCIERLLRDNVTLLRAELRRDARRAGAGVGVLAVGGVFALGGFLVLCSTAVYLLALVVPAWVSGLVVGIALLTVGGLLTWGGTRELAKVSDGARGVGEELAREGAWAKRTMHADA